MIRKQRWNLVIVLLLMLMVFGKVQIAFAQETVSDQAEGVGYAAKLYDATNGLPTSEANTILATRDGFIWIGGYSGLIRYDGTSFQRQDSSGGITNANTLLMIQRDFVLLLSARLQRTN